jgi:hypothetical protein
MQVYTHYENYQGGINNLQISRVVNGYATEKVFRSLDRTASLQADKYIKKQQRLNQSKP